jgi:CDP-diacylglycerol--glycerol-3-phosphate 3-phosphatidyltransferase
VIATGHLLIGGVLVLLAGLFDMLDGALARSTGGTTKLGGFVDSVSDRLSETALFAALIVLYTSRGSLEGVILSIVALAGAYLTSYLRARAEGLGLECRVGLFTRGERVPLLALGLLINQVLIMLGVIAVLGWITVVQRVFHVWRQTRH